MTDEKFNNIITLVRVIAVVVLFLYTGFLHTQYYNYQEKMLKQEINDLKKQFDDLKIDIEKI